MTLILWFRNDLRLRDNAALAAALESGEAILPVYVLDDVHPKQWKMGAASRWWLHQSLAALDADLHKHGLPALTYLKGDAFVQINALAKETEAAGVYWNRCYEPYAIARDKLIKESVQGAKSFGGFLMFEPWTVKNKTGGQYKVFTPYYRACLERENEIRPPLKYKIAAAAPKLKKAKGLALDDLGLMPDIKWYASMEKEWQPGEHGAQLRLKHVLEEIAGHYKDQRDFPAIDGVSRLSPFLHFGEISPHQIWHAVQEKIAARKSASFKDHALAFLRQLVWREFSWYLIYHDPHFPDRAWNPHFRGFEWQHDKKALARWQKGETGIPIVDAGMRQLWQTGWMHNRVRMIVGSFLVKNLLTDWVEGEKWFWDTLVDADLGNNAAGWQWIAGSGADAAPYFRVFNPVLQSEKFDKDGAYIKKYVPELKDVPPKYIHAPWDAPPDIKYSFLRGYPEPIVDLKKSRDRALAAYKDLKKDYDAE